MDSKVIAMTFFDFGCKLRLTAVFTDSSGAVIDPATVKFSYRSDAIGTTTTYTYPVSSLTKVSTGIYYSDIDTAETPGRYEWSWAATGTGQAAEHGEFYVRDTIAR